MPHNTFKYICDMIKVIVKKLRPKKKNDISESPIVATINAATEGFADKVRKYVKNIKCEDHKDSRLTITISANRRKTMIVKKSTYCCKKFADSIQVQIK